MNSVGKITYRKIKRISPSQFYSMKNCAYKSLLAEAFEWKPLLPISPAAYFGTILHKVIELIAKGIIRNEEDFNKIFDENVKVEEEKLREQGHIFFIPLQNNVRDFGMKRILLKKHLKHVSEKPAPSSTLRFHSEKWVESNDKLIAGKIDLVIEDEDRIEILDFKTGAITEDSLDDTGEIFIDVKQEFKEQLKLYAYLYFESTGKFPSRLSLIDLAKQRFTIDFTKEDCVTIFLNAKTLLEATNNSIESELFPANPTLSNCKYCLYRPACRFFLKYVESDLSFNDVSGLVTKVTKYRNGNVTLGLVSGANKITITSFPGEKYGELNSAMNRRISVFNLRKEGAEFVYSATKTTTIYE